jgi:hypothetical protein
MRNDLLAFFLTVIQVDKSCVFSLLTHDKRQIASATVPYDEQITNRYLFWQVVYHRYYSVNSRAKARGKGGGGYSKDYDAAHELQIADANLREVFLYWLSHPDLQKIREVIRDAIIQRVPRTSAIASSSTNFGYSCRVDLLVACNTLELTRLPWEIWNLSPENAPCQIFSISRTLMPSGDRVVPKLGFGRINKIRILAIFAEAENLDYTKDIQALQSLNRMATLEILQCRRNQAIANLREQTNILKQQIIESIDDGQGWDFLVYLGHSDESQQVGGEIEVAPGIKFSIAELEPQIRRAVHRGLRLAVFNSCSGLNIAASLLELGLQQVVIMREHIHNDAAATFLTSFCQYLSTHSDVQTAYDAAVHQLSEQRSHYPSASLVPSLFRHPELPLELFCVEPFQIQKYFKLCQLTCSEWILVGSVLLIYSFWFLRMPLQTSLLDIRIFLQSVYRDLTHQLSDYQNPPTLLIAVDKESINDAYEKIDDFSTQPIDREYLAQLIDHVSEFNFSTVGINFLLDAQEEKSEKLTQAIQTSILEQKTLFVFAISNEEKIFTNPAFFDESLSLNGDVDIEAFHWLIELPQVRGCSDICPFAYSLSLVHVIQENNINQNLLESQDTRGVLQQNINLFIENLSQNYQTNLRNTINNQDDLAKINSLINYPKSSLGLDYIIDFSIPPNRVYQYISASDFLQLQPFSSSGNNTFRNQIAIITPSEYWDSVRYPLPASLWYWCFASDSQYVCPHSREEALTRQQFFTGGEAQAYMIYHFLTSHRVLKISDLYLFIVALFFGKLFSIFSRTGYSKSQQNRIAYVIITILYIVFSFQLYISGGILLPIGLPLFVVCFYLIRDLIEVVKL